MDRHNGAMVGAQPYVDNVNWTKGIDQKPASRSTTIPIRMSIRVSAIRLLTRRSRKFVPIATTATTTTRRRTAREPSSFIIHSGKTACEFVSIDKDKPKNEKGWIPRSGGSFKVEDRYESV
jgi:hypothetical protein